MRLFIVPAFFTFALVAALTTAVSAQTVDLRTAPLTAPPLLGDQVNVTVGVNMFVPAANGNDDHQLAAQEDGRRAVYQLAAHECAVLRDTIASDCRLVSINVNAFHWPANQNFGQQRAEGYNINGNIVFRVVPKPNGGANP